MRSEVHVFHFVHGLKKEKDTLTSGVGVGNYMSKRRHFLFSHLPRSVSSVLELPRDQFLIGIFLMLPPKMSYVSKHHFLAL